jgi:hypothetical protein
MPVNSLLRPAIAILVAAIQLVPANVSAQPSGVVTQTTPAAPAEKPKLPKIDEEEPADTAQTPAEAPAATPTQESGTAAQNPDDAMNGHAVQPGSQTSAEPLFDLSVLPFPARKMHDLLLEAARTGDIEKLRPYAGTGENMTLFSFGGFDGDPIAFLKSLSGDGEGYETLAILQDVLQAGFVKLEAGTENEIYVWPYFHSVPIESLTPAQRVDLYRLVTHGDYEDMKAFGAYNFYRVGITPDGRWQFFVAGD